MSEGCVCDLLDMDRVTAREFRAMVLEDSKRLITRGGLPARSRCLNQRCHERHGGD